MRIPLAIHEVLCYMLASAIATSMFTVLIVVGVPGLIGLIVAGILIPFIGVWYYAPSAPRRQSQGRRLESEEERIRIPTVP
ncbi:MAG TPA: hypothetical protein VI893_01790 [Thermoplasmata archaeon]|nr:hypothetical protein [Thermoplasmata archaeon]